MTPLHLHKTPSSAIATGVRIVDLPVTAEKILAGLALLSK